jgi:hypothetical protein
VDALGSHDRKEAKLALRKMKAKGARLIATRSLAGTSHLRYINACKCWTCQNKVKIEAKENIHDSQAIGR